MGSTLNPDQRTITEAEVANFAKQVTKRKYNRFDDAKALQLRIREKLTYEEIAERMDAPYSHVHERINRFLKFLEDPGNLYAYQHNKPDLLEAIELKLLAYLADLLNDKKCTSVKDLSLALKVVGDMVRLNKGESTSNTMVLLKSITEAHEDPLNTRASGVEGNAITSSSVTGTPPVMGVLRGPSEEVVPSPPCPNTKDIECPTPPNESLPLNGNLTPQESLPSSSPQPDSTKPIVTLPSND